MLVRVLAIATLVLAACASSPALARSALPAPEFGYDAAAPLNAVYGDARAVAPGVVARDVTFESGGRKLTGEVIAPARRVRGPGVLFVHWLGEPKTTNHTEFEADATALAKSGVTSVLLDMAWSRRAWFGPLGKSPDADYRMSVEQVADVRRGLDLLVAQGVDKGRIAYVGHDFGAMFGMLAASVDRRPAWWVLMAPNASFGEWYLWQKPIPLRAEYLEALSVLDPGPYLKRGKARGVMIQFSQHDEFITAANAAAIVAAAPVKPDVRWYDTDHALDMPAAHADRLAWLKAHLAVH